MPSGVVATYAAGFAVSGCLVSAQTAYSGKRKSHRSMRAMAASLTLPSPRGRGEGRVRGVSGAAP